MRVFKIRTLIRSANYGTTNESASAGFFVSPKTKSRPGYTPSRAENSEITPFAIDFRALFDTIRVRISHMRKGAAGSGVKILSSAIRVTSTFADVAYSKPPRNRGLFHLLLLITYHTRNKKSRQNVESYPHKPVYCVKSQKVIPHHDL